MSWRDVRGSLLEVPLKPVAWNGLSFKVPLQWEPVRIGKTYLLLGDEHAGRLEIKWDQLRGRFAPERYLKQLRRRYAVKAAVSFQTTPLPSTWQNALKPFESAAFSWHAPTGAGQGAILHCGACRRVFLIQFYQGSRISPSTPPHRVLSTFSDHCRSPQMPWAMYDLRALLAPSWQLSAFRFDAGEFELRFAGGSQQLTLWRWGPANALLNEQGLRGFVQRQGRLPVPDQAAGLLEFGPDVLHWQIEPHLSPWGLWWARLKRRSVRHGGYRVWRVAESNRILGVALEDRHPVSVEAVHQIGAHYETG